MAADLQIRTIVSQPFEENTYVVWRTGRKDALVIDPGLEPDLILDFLKEGDLIPAAILNTHGHADHIGGNEALKSAYPQAPLLIGINEAPLLTDADANLRVFIGQVRRKIERDPGRPELLLTEAGVGYRFRLDD